MAGISMSGDLKNPARAIPAGTLGAVATGFIVYGLQIFFVRRVPIPGCTDLFIL